MDLDAYAAAHQGEWNRLRVLVRRRRLSGDEADELLDLYQRVATHLSQIRSGAPDPSVVQMLSGLVADARTKALGVRTPSWAGMGRFFGSALPGMLYRTRVWWLTTLVANVALAFAIGVWVNLHPGVQTSFVPANELQNLVQHEFSGYYSQYAAQDFAARVWTNNAWIAAVCIATGVLGLPVIYLLWMNTLNVGVMGGIMTAHGKSAEFFGLILPHGMLELTAVFVAAGVGLRLCWTWIDPGPRRRADALAQEVRSSVVVVLGLVLVLLVSGIIEAFVTPSGLPTWARIGIGAIAEVGFLAYVFVVGGRAVRAGESSDVADIDQAAAAPVAA